MSNQFEFRYVAPTEEERKEIDSIRRQYCSSEQGESKLERLRRLNAIVKNTAMIWGLSLGITGCLIFGFGLAMILEWNIWIWGIILMVVGLVPMLVSYPVYKRVLRKNKNRYGEEILRLSEELLNESDKQIKR